MSAGVRPCINGLARYGGSSSRASTEAGAANAKRPGVGTTPGRVNSRRFL
ncbi:hypothetical protein K788_0005284 [Paraburkholderia caribensis MBA4]|uniref:Uncharacterized protein n=1 Tax=Paraburkholderia caribensis MBA4 TaxID=1323664 RepID=A0A0P0RFF4_9BURK|nr:hypothetical protein K788_0005284 [Paraburkholderia caribensis MBA4]